MKQKDLLLIATVAIFSSVLSILLSNYLIAPKKSFNKKASVVDAITTEFTSPDKKYFNDKSINPTKLITIGDGSGEVPFKPKN